MLFEVATHVITAVIDKQLRYSTDLTTHQQQESLVTALASTVWEVSNFHLDHVSSTSYMHV